MDDIFNEKEPTQLCEIMGRNRSDKGNLNITNSWHNYTTFYYSIFKDIKDKPLRILIITALLQGNRHRHLQNIDYDGLKFPLSEFAVPINFLL